MSMVQFGWPSITASFSDTHEILLAGSFSLVAIFNTWSIEIGIANYTSIIIICSSTCNNLFHFDIFLR